VHIRVIKSLERSSPQLPNIRFSHKRIREGLKLEEAISIEERRD
jgi:hypothetical protein